MSAFGLGARAAYDALVAALSAGSGLYDGWCPRRPPDPAALRLGHIGDEQTQLQASSVGAIDLEPREGSDFVEGLALLIDGIRVRVGEHAQLR